MLEIAQDFEQVAARFSPIVLIGPGLTAVLAGLFVWLGGLGLRKLLAAIVGAVSGAICGFFIIGRNTMSAGLFAGLAAVTAIILEKIFIAILAAGLAAVLGFAILAGPYIQNADNFRQYPEYEISNQDTTFSIRHTVEIVEVYIADFGTDIKQTFLRMPAYRWAIIVALAATFIWAGFVLRRLTSALCCAALGTMLIFTGMILLLLYKDTMPISSICRRTSFYAAGFVAMTAFGTIEQLVLCPRYKEKPIRKEEANKEQERPDKTTSNWRNR